MAATGTRNTAIAFGDYEIRVAMKKAVRDRDVKLERVDADGKKLRGGFGPGGSRSARGVDTDAGQSKAVRVSDEKIVRVPQDRLDEIVKTSGESWQTMKVLETIDYRQVPTERIVGSYWLQPAQGSARGLRLLAEGLKDTGRVAVVKWASAGASPREHLGVIRVRHRGEKIALLLSALTFANDFLEPDEDALAINGAEVSDGAIENAARLVRSFARREEAKVDTASDEAVDARIKLVEELMDEDMRKALEAHTSPDVASGDSGDVTEGAEETVTA